MKKEEIPASVVYGSPVLTWTRSPTGGGWYPCGHFSVDQLRAITPPGTLFAVPKK